MTPPPSYTVALLCSYTVAYYTRQDLNNTPIQTVVARVSLHSTITICNIYSLVVQSLGRQMLEHIQRQLPQPFIMLGISMRIISCGGQITQMLEVGKWSDSLTKHFKIMNDVATRNLYKRVSNRSHNVLIHFRSRSTMEHNSIAAGAVINTRYLLHMKMNDRTNSIIRIDGR